MKTIRTLLVGAVVAIGFVAPAKQAAAQCLAPGFEGIWHGNDGGTYRIRYSASGVVWEGRSSDNGRSWANQFVGTRQGDVLTGEWHDVAGRHRGSGTLTIEMKNDHHLVRTASTGSAFGATEWTRPVPFHGCDDNQGHPG